MKSGEKFSQFDEKLLECIRNRDYSGIKNLIKAGAKVNITDPLGRTPLHIAVEKGEFALIELLLNHPSINVDVEDKYGRTPLFLATAKGQVQIVKRLLAGGADIRKVV